MIIKNNIFFTEVEQLLSEGQEVTILVKGNSMRPLLRNERDRVILRKHRDEDIRKGAVMLFRYRGSYVMHRVVKIEDDVVIFEGDGNYKLQEIATRKDIVAVVVAIVLPSGKSIGCDSRRWRLASWWWLSKTRFERRVILGIMRRLKL